MRSSRWGRHWAARAEASLQLMCHPRYKCQASCGAATLVSPPPHSLANHAALSMPAISSSTRCTEPVACSALEVFPPLLGDRVVLASKLSAMQVGNQDKLNCYYAHADEDDGLQVSHLCAAASGEQFHSLCGGGHPSGPHGMAAPALLRVAMALVSAWLALCLLVDGPAGMQALPVRRHRTALGLVGA